MESNVKKFVPVHIAKKIVADYAMFTPRGDQALSKALAYFEKDRRWPVAGDELLLVATAEHLRVASEHKDHSSQKIFVGMLNWVIQHSQGNIPPKAMAHAADCLTRFG